MPDTFDRNANLFLGHVLAVLIVAIWAMFAPLYVASTSGGEVYTLSAIGWSGDPAAGYALGTTNTGDYPSVLWALVIAVAGGLVLLVTVFVQKKTPVNLWISLAMLAWVPVVVPCLFLGADGFPMPAFTATDSTIDITISAGLGTALWAQVLVAGCTLGGTIVTYRLPAAKPVASASQTNFLGGTAFHKLQAELVIRQSHASPENIPSNKFSNS